MNEKIVYGDINYLQFGVASPTEILENSVCEITSSSLRNDLQDTVYDPRMGVLGNGECQTCGNDTIVCPGHFGHVVLEEPIMHPKFLKTIISILKCVCYSCSACLITLEHARLLGLLKYKMHDRLKFMSEKCQKEESCPKCGDPKPLYSMKDNKIKLSYSEKMSKANPVKSGTSKGGGTKGNSKNSKKNSQPELRTRDVYNVLLKISNEDFELIGFNQQLSLDNRFLEESQQIDENVRHRHQVRPEWMIFTVLPVLPPACRPYTHRDGEQHDDDLTDKYVSIVKANQKLKSDRLGRTSSVPVTTEAQPQKGRRRGGKLSEAERKKVVQELTDHIYALIDNSNEQSKISGGRPHKGIKERISSKEGQMRHNIMGKRVNFSARTVIGGDPTLELDELGVPKQIAQRLTKPEFVTSFNLEKMQKLVDSGNVNFVFRSGTQFSLNSGGSSGGTKRDFQLQVRDVVERQMMDGDWVLFNRQPTLRIESMMGFRVKVMDKGKTFRFNLATCTAFNADFDGRFVAVNRETEKVATP